MNNQTKVIYELSKETTKTGVLMRMNEMLMSIHLDMEQENNMHKLAALYLSAADVLYACSAAIEALGIKAKE